jgi:hypothetical protein
MPGATSASIDFLPLQIGRPLGATPVLSGFPHAAGSFRRR